MKENNRKAIARRARQRKQRARRVALTLCLIVATMLVSVGGTIAWLTATSGTVTNTFTTGNITIKLDEADLTSTTGGRTETGNTGYKIYPGAVIDKDPTVTVNVGSEPCYVYVSVENNLLVNGASVATFNIDTVKWIKVGETDNESVYKYVAIVDALSAEQKLPAVFTTVTIDTEAVTKDNIADLTNKTVVINAYAHQSNATTEAAATTAALTHFGVDAL